MLGGEVTGASRRSLRVGASGVCSGRRSGVGHMRDVGHHGGGQIAAGVEGLLFAQVHAEVGGGLVRGAFRLSQSAGLEPGLCAFQHFAGHDRVDHDGHELFVVAELLADDGGAGLRRSGGGEGGCSQHGHAVAQVGRSEHEVLLLLTVEERDVDIQLPFWGRWFLFEYSTLYIKTKLPEGSFVGVLTLPHELLTIFVRLRLQIS